MELRRDSQCQAKVFLLVGIDTLVCLSIEATSLGEKKVNFVIGNVNGMRKNKVVNPECALGGSRFE